MQTIFSVKYPRYIFLNWDSILKRKIESLLELYNDVNLGISTRGIDYENRNYGIHNDSCFYHGTPYVILNRIFKFIRLNKEDIFVDVGCGKGRVVFYVASRFCLEIAVGLEIQKHLVEIAEANLRTARKIKSNIQFYNTDVTSYNFHTGNVFFFYNPFGISTLKMVLSNIRDSLLLKQRAIQIIYFHPSNSAIELLNSTGWLVSKGKIPDLEIGKVTFYKSMDVNVYIWITY